MVDGFTVENSLVDSDGGAVLCNLFSPTFSNCVFSGNFGGGNSEAAGYGGGLYLGSIFGASTAVISKTIIAFGPQGEAVLCEAGSSAILSCSDVFGNAGGDWVGCLARQSGTNSNFSGDPLFCNAAGGDLTLDASSPCAPDHSPAGCDLIGALPVACGTAAIASETAPAAAVAIRVVPNPLATGGVIRWVNERPRAVTLSLYDSLGRLVLARDVGTTGAGRQEIAWDRLLGSTKLASGVYFLRLEGALGPARATRVVVTR